MLINNIARKRKEMGITQEELARNIKVSTRTIQNIEASSTIPNIEIVLKIKKVLQCKSTEELYYLDE